MHTKEEAPDRTLYTEVLPGIYRVILTDTTIEQGVSSIGIYIVKGSSSVQEGRSLMIDTGFRRESCLQKLLSALDALAIPTDTLDVFLTHRHHDHSGLAGRLADLGARIFMNPAEERHPYDCLAYRVSEESLQAQKKVLRSVGITETLTPFAWDSFMKVSERVQQHGEWVLAILGFPYTAVQTGDAFSYGDYHFTAYPLKGHTYGQMGLMDREKRIFFVADQLLHGVSPIVATTYPDEHLLEGMFSSLRDIKEHYADWTLLPAHGMPISDAKKDVDCIVLSYLSKSTKALEYLKAGSTCTVHDVAKGIYPMDDRPDTEAAFFTYKMLLTKTFSLLEYLHDLGFVQRTEQDGIFYWSTQKHGTE